MNTLDRQITQEGPRNAVVKLTGTLDSGDISEAPAIAIGDMLNNDTRMFLTGFRVDLLEWSISAGLEVNLYWNSTTPKQIFPLAGRGRIYANNYGGFIPDATLPGYDGSINLVTVGFSTAPQPVCNFTIILELVKLYRVN